MGRLFGSVVGMVAVLALGGPDVLPAQRAKVVLTPLVGGYVPLTDLGSASVSIGGQNVTASAKMQAAPLFGAKFGYYPRGRFGLEVGYFFSSPKSRISVGASGREDDGEVQGGSLKGSYRLTDGTTDTDFFLSAGLSGTNHGGDLFDATQAQDQFDVGGAVGAGLHVQLSPQVTLRVEGDLNVYKWSQFRIVSSKTQADFLLTAGLGLRLGR